MFVEATPHAMLKLACKACKIARCVRVCLSVSAEGAGSVGASPASGGEGGREGEREECCYNKMFSGGFLPSFLPSCGIRPRRRHLSFGPEQNRSGLPRQPGPPGAERQNGICKLAFRD